MVRLGAAVTDCEDLGDRVRVTLEGGEAVEGDALVACDGARSAVRPTPAP